MERIEVTDIDNLAAQLISNQGPWVYRGQLDSSWELEPSISRLIPDGLTANVIHQIEKDLRYQFESTAIHYSARADLPHSDFGWLSLMQHHSAPTRLLDFTESPFMALFFAFDGANPTDGKSSSVIAMDYRTLNQTSLDLMGTKMMDFEWDYRKFQLGGDKFFSDVLYKHVHDFLWILEPSVKNRRMLQQKGTFLIKGDLSVKTKDTISRVYADVPMKEYIIPHSLMSNVFELLAKCGITYYGVYPGLEGLGRNVRLTLQQSIRKARGG